MEPHPARARNIEKRMQEIGTQLYEEFFNSRDAIKPWRRLQSIGLNKMRVEILTSVQDAMAIPWELMCDPDTKEPLVMEVNLKALESRHAGHVAIERYIEITPIVTGNKNTSAQDGVKWVSDLVSELNIPPLSAHGMNESHVPEAVETTLNASSFKGNPIALSEVELREVLEKAL